MRKKRKKKKKKRARHSKAGKKGEALGKAVAALPRRLEFVSTENCRRFNEEEEFNSLYGRRTKRKRGDNKDNDVNQSRPYHHDRHLHQSNSHKDEDKKQATVAQDQKQQLDERQLSSISDLILAHVKQQGLFDEIRMRLLGEVEGHQEFESIKDKINKEIDHFCWHEADLSLSRARLRQQLTSEFPLKSSKQMLKRHIKQLVARHRQELQSVYSSEVQKYLTDNGLAAESSSSSCSNGKRKPSVGAMSSHLSSSTIKGNERQVSLAEHKQQRQQRKQQRPAAQVGASCSRVELERRQTAKEELLPSSGKELSERIKVVGARRPSRATCCASSNNGAAPRSLRAPQVCCSK